MRRLPERKGWAKAFQEMAKNGDDKLVMPDVFNDEIIHDELPGIRR